MMHCKKYHIFLGCSSKGKTSLPRTSAEINKYIYKEEEDKLSVLNNNESHAFATRDWNFRCDTKQETRPIKHPAVNTSMFSECSITGNADASFGCTYICY